MQLAWVLCAAAVLSTATSTSVSIHDINAYLHHLGKEIVHAAKTVGVEIEHGAENLAHEAVHLEHEAVEKAKHVGQEIKEGVQNLVDSFQPLVHKAEQEALVIDHALAEATGIHTLHDFICNIFDHVKAFGEKECAPECTAYVHNPQLASYCTAACNMIIAEGDHIFLC